MHGPKWPLLRHFNYRAAPYYMYVYRKCRIPRKCRKCKPTLLCVGNNINSQCFRKVKSKTLRGFLSCVCVCGYRACRLPETSTLLTYLMPDRKGLASGSGFSYLSVCRRSVSPCSGRDDVEVEALVLRLDADYLVKVSPCFASTFCSVLAPWQSAQLVEGDLSAVRNSLPFVSSSFYRGWIFFTI